MTPSPDKNTLFRSLQSFAATGLVLLATACATHQYTLVEKPGSAALANGLNMETRGEFTAAATQFERAAGEAEDAITHARALVQLAGLYGTGKGVPRDSLKQVSLLQEAIALGDPAATFKLATVYRNGTPEIPADKPKAHRLFNSIKYGYPLAAAALIDMKQKGEITAGEDETVALAGATVTQLETLAMQGNDGAMLALARLYRDGTGVTQSNKLMERWYRSAIDMGNLNAAAELGTYWLLPISGHMEDEALTLLKQVAGRNPALVAEQIGSVYERRGHMAEAVTWYEKAASGTSGRDLLMKLGDIYANGTGVPQDSWKSFYWYEKAAEMGSETAMKNVASAYYNGKGVAADTAKGDAWLEKFSAGNPQRIYGMAKAFSTGVGAPKNDAKAFALYLKAARAGHHSAIKAVAQGYEMGVGTAANPKEADAWYNKLPLSERNRGDDSKRVQSPALISAIAHERKGEIDQAVSLYKEASASGETQAMLKLANVYAVGMNGKQDLKAAFSWYQKAAQAGSAEGQYQTGMAYARGFGVSKDIAKAREWLERAGNNGYPLARQTLNSLTGN